MILDKTKNQLNVTEKQGLRGFFIFQVIDAITGKVLGESAILENTLTKVNREYRQAMLDGTFLGKGYGIDDLEIKYFGLGTGTTPSTEDDLTLETETFRAQLSSVSTLGTDTTSVVSLTPSEANFQIREIGVFCGPTATASFDTGIMISRINVDFTKIDNISLNIIRVDRTVI